MANVVPELFNPRTVQFCPISFLCKLFCPYQLFPYNLEVALIFLSLKTPHKCLMNLPLEPLGFCCIGPSTFKSSRSLLIFICGGLKLFGGMTFLTYLYNRTISKFLRLRNFCDVGVKVFKFRLSWAENFAVGNCFI